MTNTATQTQTIGNAQTPHIGLTTDARDEMAEALGDLLIDNYALYLKTHAYHFNVTGPQFGALHLAFENQYQDLWAAFDQIAERIRTVGAKVRLDEETVRGRGKVAREKPGDQDLAWDAMVQNLVKGHEQVGATIRGVMKLAERHDDEGTMDLLATRLAVHEKTAWMLRAHLG